MLTMFLWELLAKIIGPNLQINCLPRHLGQHCPGRGGSGFGQLGRAHVTSLQSMVGRIVGSGGFVAVGSGGFVTVGSGGFVAVGSGGFVTVGSGGFVGGGLVAVCIVSCRCV